MKETEGHLTRGDTRPMELVAILVVAALALPIGILVCLMLLRATIDYVVDDNAIEVRFFGFRLWSVAYSNLASIRVVSLRQTIGLRSQFMSIRLGNRFMRSLVELRKDGSPFRVLIPPADQEAFVLSVKRRSDEHRSSPSEMR